jgi:Uma2 family endonuclease
MTALLSPPPLAPVRPASVIPQVSSRPFRWTLKEYRELDKIGFFHDRRTMLLDGEIILMANPSDAHDMALGKLDDWVRTVFAVGFHVRNQMGFDVGEDTDPSPDLVIAVGTRAEQPPGKPRTAALLVEVADSSLFIDTTTKAEKYATAGVKDYWVIDLEHRLLLVCRDPVELPAGLGATAYRTHLRLTDADSVSPLAAPGATVRVADLLP